MIIVPVIMETKGARLSTMSVIFRAACIESPGYCRGAVFCSLFMCFLLFMYVTQYPPVMCQLSLRFNVQGKPPFDGQVILDYNPEANPTARTTRFYYSYKHVKAGCIQYFWYDDHPSSLAMSWVKKHLGCTAALSISLSTQTKP